MCAFARLPWLAMVLFALWMGSAKGAEPVMTAEEFLAAYEAALAAQDWDEVDPLIHPNCVVTFSSGQVNEGKAAVEKAFRTNFDLIEEEEYAMSKVNWIVKTGEFAVLSFEYDWSGVIHGSPASGGGRGTSSLIKEDGKWLLVAEHLGPRKE